MSKIGMRTIKTAISVFLCIIILRLINIPYPFYACIAAVISMQSSISDSFTTGKNRMIGTTIGAAIGLVFALIKPENAFMAGLGIIVVIYLCNVLNKKKSTTIACIVFLAIMINLKGGNPYMYSFNRLLETFIGISIAVLVNYFLVPPSYVDKLCTSCNKLVDDIFIFSGNMLKNKEKLDLFKIEKEILDLEGALNLYLKEISSKKINIIKVDNMKKILNICKSAYNHLLTVENLKDTCILNEDNYIKYKELYNENFILEDYTSSDPNTVFNYHVNELIEILNELKTINISGLLV